MPDDPRQPSVASAAPSSSPGWPPTSDPWLSAAGSVPPPPDEPPEISSARRALRALDKASRAARTYGPANTVTERFLAQLEAAFTSHLASHGVLAVVVGQSELTVRGTAIYRTEDSVGEGLAFRLFADGIRELRFDPGLTREGLLGFLDALWGRDDPEEQDDDIATRLWSKNLPFVSLVTAEDIVRAPWVASAFAPQESGFFAPPPPSFKGVLEQEGSASGASATGVQATGVQAAAPAGPAGLYEGALRAAGVAGFEVSAGEQAALQEEARAESEREPIPAVLEMLRAILASERSQELLGRGLALIPDVLDALLLDGRWSEAAALLAFIDNVADHNQAYEPTARLLAARAADSLRAPQRVSLIALGLNALPERAPEGLALLLSRLPPAAVPALCGVLAALRSEAHRAALREVLAWLGPQNPGAVLKGLAGPESQAVRDLIAVVISWGQPQAAEELAMLAGHRDAEVRREALLGVVRLWTAGDASPLLAFVRDPERAVRMQALRFLGGGAWLTPWETWTPFLEEDLQSLPAVDRRMLFHAMRATCGDAAVPFLRGLLGAKGWRGRGRKDETALIAADVLTLHGTPAAREALLYGLEEGSTAVQEACAAALQIPSQPPSKQG